MKLWTPVYDLAETSWYNYYSASIHLISAWNSTFSSAKKIHSNNAKPKSYYYYSAKKDSLNSFNDH